MRISPSNVFAGFGAFAGLVTIIAIAFAQPGHAAPAKACPTPAAGKAHVKTAHASGHAHRARIVRAHAWRGHSARRGYVDRRGWRSEPHWGDADHWAGGHRWTD